MPIAVQPWATMIPWQVVIDPNVPLDIALSVILVWQQRSVPTCIAPHWFHDKHALVLGRNGQRGRKNQFSSVHCSWRWYPHVQESPSMLHPVITLPKSRIAYEKVPMLVWLTMALSRPFQIDLPPLPFSMPLNKATGGVMSLALWPQVVSQAPQHCSKQCSYLCLVLSNWPEEISVCQNAPPLWLSCFRQI